MISADKILIKDSQLAINKIRLLNRIYRSSDIKKTDEQKFYLKGIVSDLKKIIGKWEKTLDEWCQ